MIIVSYSSEILGDGTFWKGPENQIQEIRNIPARKLAEKVASDGKERKDGMWTVKQMTEF